MKKFTTKTLVALLACGITNVGLAEELHRKSFMADKFRFNVELNAEQMLEDVSTQSTGKAVVEFDPGMTKVEIRLDVFDAYDVTAAHLHCAPAGQNAGVVLFLFNDSAGVYSNGTLVDQTFTRRDVQPSDPVSNCGTTINNIASLYAAAMDNRLYINIHSASQPGIRGQLFKY